VQNEKEQSTALTSDHDAPERPEAARDGPSRGLKKWRAQIDFDEADIIDGGRLEGCVTHFGEHDTFRGGILALMCRTLWIFRGRAVELTIHTAYFVCSSQQRELI
jgi:hypothetical protein